MTVVVTGAAGFIGRHVVRTLLERGADVVGIDRRQWLPMGSEEAVVADLARPSPLVEGLLHAATGVVHLAGHPGVRYGGADAVTRRRLDNVVAGQRVLGATPGDVMVVVASSSSVYGGAGDPRTPRACREDDPLRPVGGYARSKAVLERHCALRAAHGGLVGVVRPFTVAGEGQRPDMAVSRWIAALRRGQAVTVFGSPARRRDVTDVRDVAEGIVRMLERRVTDTVNLGTGASHRLDELIGHLGTALGVSPRMVIEPAVSEEVAATKADVDRCRWTLDLSPSTDPSGVLDRQVAATAPVVPALVS